MLRVLFFLVLCILDTSIFGQAADGVYPEVGKKMPDFVLKNIDYYPLKTARLKDFKGKWLVLDFWNKYCSSCVESFPYINRVQQELGDKVQVMLVGIQDKEGEIAPMFKKFREHLHLILPCAFDSAIASRFDIYAAPHTIIIDDNGVVRGISAGTNVREMKMFMDGMNPFLSETKGMSEKKVYDFDEKKPLLIGNNGGADTGFLFRSVLCSWNGDTRGLWLPEDIGVSKAQGMFQVVAVPLEWLYNYAFFGVPRWNQEDSLRYGKCFNHLILESKDSAVFRYSYNFQKGLYSYSCMMPSAQCTSTRLENSLRNDLENYFGFDARIERRKCPYWKLVATDDARRRLATKGGKSIFQLKAGHLGLFLRNCPMGRFVKDIQNSRSKEIIIDETGIVGNIDIDLECIAYDFDDLRMALGKNGLALIKDEMVMNALVIKDPRIVVGEKE